jgi:multimeric flavodoxin WrbA
MRILVLVGSYRQRGNTAQIAELIIEHLHCLAAHDGEPLEVETINLAHREIHFCRGCRVCFDKGEDRCPLRDDLLEIKARMQAADGLLLAAPVYVNDVNGAVKNWIDRLAHVCHRPEFPGRCAYLVATVGDSPTRHALRTMSVALSTWGYHIVGQAGFKMGALMDQQETVARFEERTEQIAESLYRAVRERAYVRPSFVSLMTFKIQQLGWRKAPAGSLDYAHWSGKGWIEPEREFYLPHRANLLKVAVARAAGALIARFVT